MNWQLTVSIIDLLVWIFANHLWSSFTIPCAGMCYTWIGMEILLPCLALSLLYHFDQ